MLKVLSLFVHGQMMVNLHVRYVMATASATDVDAGPGAGGSKLSVVDQLALLITLVRDNEVLYNKQHAKYLDANHK